MGKGDSAKITFGGKERIISVKSTSDFGVLIEVDGNSFVVGKGESKEIDLDGDSKADMKVSLDKITDGIATLTFIKPKSKFEGGGIAGLATLGNPNPAFIAAVAVIGLIIIGGIAFKLKGRRSNERGIRSFRY